MSFSNIERIRLARESGDLDQLVEAATSAPPERTAARRISLASPSPAAFGMARQAR